MSPTSPPPPKLLGILVSVLGATLALASFVYLPIMSSTFGGPSSSTGWQIITQGSTAYHLPNSLTSWLIFLLLADFPLSLVLILLINLLELLPFHRFFRFCLYLQSILVALAALPLITSVVILFTFFILTLGFFQPEIGLFLMLVGYVGLPLGLAMLWDTSQGARAWSKL